MFDYDYTLEESGVEIEEKSNKQVSRIEIFTSSVAGIIPVHMRGCLHMTSQFFFEKTKLKGNDEKQ